MKQVTEFRSMLSAIAYLLGAHADQVFKVIDAPRRWVERELEAMPHDSRQGVSANIASTFAEYAMDSDCVAAYSIDSEKHYGIVFAHYTSLSEVVRFVVLPA